MGSTALENITIISLHYNIVQGRIDFYIFFTRDVPDILRICVKGSCFCEN